jgi:hypothetical protein
MFRVDDASLIGRPENPPAIPVEDVFLVGGQTLVVRARGVFRHPARTEGPVPGASARTSFRRFR